MINVITGLPGSGKSMYIAHLLTEIAHRNKRWEEKTGRGRFIYTNMPIGEKMRNAYEGMFKRWDDLEELPKIRDADVVIDEIATYMDSQRWQDMSLSVKRWLQQHRKMGIEIYGTAQDFAQCDRSFRRLTSELLYITKLIGSRDVSPTKPIPKLIWGICLIRPLDPQKYDEDKKEMVGIPKIFTFGKAETELYDSYTVVETGKYPALKHIERTCENPNCRHVKISHV